MLANSQCVAIATSVFELTDVSDEEMYFPIGIWLTLAEAIAYVDACKEPSDLHSDGEHDDSCQVEIRERKLGPSTHGKKVFERRWVQKYDDSADKYEWHVVKQPCGMCGGSGLIGGWVGGQEGGYETEDCPACVGAATTRPAAG